MLRAYDVMTRAVAIVTPDTPVAQVATTMRDLNIGDVVVAQDGELRGIVTDRDLTIQVLTNGADTQAPISHYMTRNVVTGNPDWSLRQVAQVMGDHQVRRLPIVQDGIVVGIVSLGDVALHVKHENTVAGSLRGISESARSRWSKSGSLARVLSLVLPVAVTTGVVAFALTKPGRRMRKQLMDSGMPDKAMDLLNDLVHAVTDPRTRDAALELLEVSQIPDRARQVVSGGMEALRDTQMRDQVTHLSKATRKRAQALAKQANHLKNKRIKDLLPV
jgi:CBS domain-containing protein